MHKLSFKMKRTEPPRILDFYNKPGKNKTLYRFFKNEVMLGLQRRFAEQSACQSSSRIWIQKFSTHIKCWALWQANSYIPSTGSLLSSLVSRSRVSESPRLPWGILRLAPWERHLGLTLAYTWTCSTHRHTKGKVDAPCSRTVIHMRFCSLKDQNQELAFTGSRLYCTLPSLVGFSPLEAEVQTLGQQKLRLSLLSSSKKG